MFKMTRPKTSFHVVNVGYSTKYVGAVQAAAAATVAVIASVSTVSAYEMHFL